MTYNNSSSVQSANVDDVVLNGVLKVLDRGNHAWSGTMTQLGSTLVRTVGKSSSEDLPNSPSALRVVLNRVVNRLRSRGVSVKFVRAGGTPGTRLVKFAQ